MSRENLAINIILSAADYASKDIEAVNSKVKELARELDRSEFSRTAEAVERFGTAVKNATQPMADAAKQGLAFAGAMTAVTTALAGQVYKAAVSYESALLDLGKVLEGGREQAEQYGEQLNVLADQYAQNGQELIGAMTNFVQAGYKADEAFRLVEASTQMMIAGDMEATESAKNLISILKGFDAPASEAAHAVDLLNEVSNNYATDVKQLSDGMAALSPVAKQMGFTLDETAGLLTPIIEVYQSGAEAADALKVGLLKLTDDAKPVRDALAEIGVAQRDANGQLRSGKDIFLDVARAFETLSDTDKLDLTARLVGLEQAGRMSTALGNLNKVMAITETAANASGSAMKEVETRLSSAQAQIDRANERFRQLATTLGNQFKTEITGVVAASGELAKAFDGAVQGGALEPLLNALRPQVAAIETLFRAMAENLDEALNGLDWSPLVEALSELSGEFGGAFRAITDGMDLTTVDGLQKLLQSLINLMGNFTQYIAGVVDGLGPLMSAINLTFGYISRNRDTISNLTGQLHGLALSINTITPVITKLGTFFSGVVGDVVELTVKIGLLIAAVRLLAGTGALPLVISLLGKLVMWFGRLNPAIASAIAAMTGLSGAVGVLALGTTGLAVGLGLLLNKLANLANESLEAKTGIDLLSNAQERAQKSADWSSNRLGAKLKEISDQTGVTVTNMKELDAAVKSGALVQDAATGAWSKGNAELKRMQAEAKANAAASQLLTDRAADEEARIKALTDAYRAQGLEYDARTGAVKRSASADKDAAAALTQTAEAAQLSLDGQRRLAAERIAAVEKSDALVEAEQRLTDATREYQSAQVDALQNPRFTTAIDGQKASTILAATAYSDASERLLDLRTNMAVAQAEVDRLTQAEGAYTSGAERTIQALEWRNGALRAVANTTDQAAGAQSRLSAAIQKASETDAESYADKLGEIRAKQSELINLADAEAVRRRVLAQELGQDLGRIEEEIAANKTRVLSQIQGEYQRHISSLNAAARQHLDEVRRIEDEIAALKLSTEDRLRALQQQGMTDYQRYQDQQSQIAEKGAAARKALLDGEFQKAADLYEEQAALAERSARRVTDGDKEIVSEQSAVKAAYAQVAEAMAGKETALQSMADSTKARAEAANVALEQTKTAADSVSTSVQNLDGSDTTSQHTVESNAYDILSELEKLDGHDTSSTHTVYQKTVQTAAEGGLIEPARFAAGGRVPGFPEPRWSTVPGSGNTDSVPAALPAGAFVLKKAASRYYGRSLLDLIARFAAGGRVPALLMPGERLFQPRTVERLGVGFFDAINQMRLPRDEILAALGTMTAPVARFAAGGAVGSASGSTSSGSRREVVDIRIQIEDSAPVHLQGARDQARALAAALRTLNRRS